MSLPSGVRWIEARLVQQDIVVRAVGVDDVHDHFQPEFVSLRHQRFQVGLGAVLGIDHIVVFDFVRRGRPEHRGIAVHIERADVDDGGAQVGNVLQVRGRGIQRSFRREGAHPDLVDDRPAHEVRSGARILRGHRRVLAQRDNAEGQCQETR